MAQATEKKTAIVTGGGSGIGRSICKRLADNEISVEVLDLDLDSAEETVEEIQKANGRATAHACDVANRAEVTSVVGKILAAGHADILVNNAGIAHVGNIEQTLEADMDRLYNVNVKGVYNAMAAVIPAMKARQQGVIVNVGSIVSMVGVADRFAYSMTKGAVLTMTYSVAKDYIGEGIRCNCISPARIHTPFVDNFLAKNYPDNRDEMFDKLSKSQPIGRMGTVGEVAGMVAYLCSEDASFITGSNFPIDGGFSTLNS